MGIYDNGTRKRDSTQSDAVSLYGRSNSVKYRIYSPSCLKQIDDKYHALKDMYKLTRKRDNSIPQTIGYL
jgi:hypothetical protein